MNIPKKIPVLAFALLVTGLYFDSSSSSQNIYSSDNDIDYYFCSTSQDPFSPDNSIIIQVSNEGYAYVSMDFHAKAYYPKGVGEHININIPYPTRKVIFLKAKISQNDANYMIISGNETKIQVETPSSPRDIRIHIEYVVLDVYDGENFRMKFKFSSYVTEILIAVTLNSTDKWLSRKFIELNPKPSEETYFLINTEVLPFSSAIVLSNLKPITLDLSFRSLTPKFKLEQMPFLAFLISTIPHIGTATIKLLFKKLTKHRIGVFTIAYRNLVKRSGSFALAILSVAIPSLVVAFMITQRILAEKIMGEYTTEVGWQLTLILAITTLVSGFQVVNVTLSSFLERIKELGLMKAIGFKPSFIKKMVIAETTLIGLISGVLGATIGVAYSTFSYHFLYGESLSNAQLMSLISETLGGADLTKNMWYRNCLISEVAALSFSIILSQTSLVSSIIGLVLFVIFLRPYDPFILQPLLETVPVLVITVSAVVSLAALLCISAGLYVAKIVSKIKPMEAMRRV